MPAVRNLPHPKHVFLSTLLYFRRPDKVHTRLRKACVSRPLLDGKHPQPLGINTRMYRLQRRETWRQTGGLPMEWGEGLTTYGRSALTDTVDGLR